MADPYTDLQRYAKEVPWAAIDQEVAGYVANETNESTEGMQSNYTLGLFEDTSNETSWYILDGYYRLQSGRILFLDFNYYPEKRSWQAIQNYEFYLPGFSRRYLLEADEICNPYKRHYIGMLRAPTAGLNLDRLKLFFTEQFGRQPLFVVDDDLLLIADPTKSSRNTEKLMFTLSETKLAEKLSAFGLKASLLPSGRLPSSPERKQTYVGSTPSCEFVGNR